jgi:hypothetical protein
VWVLVWQCCVHSQRTSVCVCVCVYLCMHVYAYSALCIHVCVPTFGVDALRGRLGDVVEANPIPRHLHPVPWSR